MQHKWMFFGGQPPPIERSLFADRASPDKRESPLSRDKSPTWSRRSMGDATRSSSDMEELRSVLNRRLSLQTRGKKFRRAGTLQTHHTTHLPNSELFQPGEYIYPFELAIGNDMPESIDVQYGSVKWELEALVGRVGWFRPNLSGTKGVTLVRVPGEDSIERTEPIVHRKFWENSLRYELVISGRWFALGSRIPIAFTFTPLATVRCLRVEIALMEEVERFARHSNGLPSRIRRSIRLLERDENGTMSSAYPGSSVRTFFAGNPPDNKPEKAAPLVTMVQADDILHSPEGRTEIASMTWDFMAQLPNCNTTRETQPIHVDTASKHIQVRHSMKVYPSSHYTMRRNSLTCAYRSFCSSPCLTLTIPQIGNNRRLQSICPFASFPAMPLPPISTSPLTASWVPQTSSTTSVLSPRSHRLHPLVMIRQCVQLMTMTSCSKPDNHLHLQRTAASLQMARQQNVLDFDIRRSNTLPPPKSKIEGSNDQFRPSAL